MEKKLVLGLDIGIASLGWSVLEKNEIDEFKCIKDLGVLTFSQLESGDSGKLENKQRREKRSMRRQRRRKNRRLVDLSKLIVRTFNITLNSKIFTEYNNPYEIKVKGLTQQLSNTEISIILYHYMKYRGFQSTRKVEDAKNDGVILKAIEEIKSKMVDKTITQVLLEQYNSKDKECRRIHNTEGEYNFTISREMYIEEISIILENQIKFGVISTTFKDEFFELYNRRRDFSEGPGKGSKFGSEGSFIEKMIGKCKYDDNLRAPRESYSAQAFTLLSFLNNFRFKESILEKNYSKLDSNQITNIFEYSKTKKELSYNDIYKVAKINFFRIKGVELTKKKYVEILKKYTSLSSDNTALDEGFKELINKEILNIKIKVGMSFYYNVNKTFDNFVKLNESAKNSINEFKQNETNYDILAKCLLVNKTDAKVEEYLRNNNFDQNIINASSSLSSITQTVNLSVEICNKLLPLLKNGVDYEGSMKAIGYHINESNAVEKTKFLPEIGIALDKLNISLTNPNVKHTLVQVRKLINEVIKKYGEIDTYAIEFSRDLKNSFEQRKQIKFDMLDNRNANDNVKTELIKKYPEYFKSISNIKKDDVIKFKLFKEQSFLCAYTAEMINEKDLFDNNLYQIDHILPYSRSFDDSYTNKVLVSTKINQLKGNKMPSEASCIDIANVMKVINNSNIGFVKRDKLLSKEIPDDFIERNINDTSYMARLARELIQSFLQPRKCTCPSGRITSKLKSMWKLNGYTHSYLNSKYFNKNTYSLDTFNISEKKISFDFTIVETLQKETIEIVLKNFGKEKKNIDLINNNMIKFFYRNSSLLEGLLMKYKNKSIYLLLDEYDFDTNDLNKSEFNEHLVILLTNIRNLIGESKNKKNRDNHLHHAIDAAIVACATDKMVKRITKYFMNPEQNMIVDDETGEIRHNYDLFPKPYDDFKFDLIYRVYERNNDVLLNNLNSLSCYSNSLERRDVKVLLPVRIKDTYNAGTLTKDTIFGMRNNVITKRISVDKLDMKNVEKIVGSTKQNPIKQSCIDWISLGVNKPKYPYHPTRNNPIKSVLLEVTDNIESRVKLKENENRFAENASCVSVDVYKKKNDESGRLYFCPIFYYQTISKNKLNINYQIMWGQGKNFEYVKGEKLNDEFIKLHSLPRYSVIELELINGSKGLCYSAGVSSGMFEVYSVIGDGLDLFNDKITLSIKERYQITVSTIKSIKVRSISILGFLN